MLGTWLSSRNSASEQAVLAFWAFEYAPSDLAGLELGFVGMLDRDEVDAACPRHPEVRNRTDRADAAVRRAGGEARGPAVFGTLVHTHLKRQIDNLGELNFIAEKSLLKSRRAARYGQRGSIRIDVLERVGNGVVCAYDIKTGDAKLTKARVAEIARNVGKNYPEANRIIIIETKPSKK